MDLKIQSLVIKMMLEQDVILAIFQLKDITSKILILNYKPHVIFNVIVDQDLLDQELADHLVDLMADIVVHGVDLKMVHGVD